MNRYGVDEKYFAKKMMSIMLDLKNYTPSELLREFQILANAVRPADECAKCGKNALAIFDERLNTCLDCGNTQNVKGR